MQLSVFGDGGADVEECFKMSDYEGANIFTDNSKLLSGYLLSIDCYILHGDCEWIGQGNVCIIDLNWTLPCRYDQQWLVLTQSLQERPWNHPADGSGLTGLYRLSGRLPVCREVCQKSPKKAETQLSK